jgi:hypothetical protein
MSSQLVAIYSYYAPAARHPLSQLPRSALSSQLCRPHERMLDLTMTFVIRSVLERAPSGPITFSGSIFL